MAWVIPQDQSQLLQHIGASLAVALFYDGKDFTFDLDEFLDQQIRDIVTIRVDLNKVKDAVNKYRLVNLPTWRFFSKGVDLKLDVPEEDLDRVKEIIIQQLNKQTAMTDIKSFKEYTALISEKDTVHCVYYYSKSHLNYDYMSKVDSFSLKHDHAKFYSVDIDKFKDICKMNDLEGVHTIHFFINGEKLPIRSTPPFKDFEKTISEYLYTYDRKKKDIQGQSLRRRGASLSTKREMPESERLQIQTGDDRPRTGSASPIEMTSNRVERRSTLTRRVVVESDENIADKKVVDDRNIVDQKDSLRIEKSDALPRKILVSGEQSKFRLI
ncbi:hypothetical protein HK103_000881 [Boothiomyces macroporosus]|uniref:Uncharacterized protein n=1 Tax=Boothiomyces macroporosus TaxID=261099 RepID=A0AAD5Y5N9_9FUNG|nr:hypothetical protein HK103_000881 [Boothiomyces macroporosus]